MDTLLEGVSVGFGTALQPEAVLLCLVGVTIGTFVGMFPGLSSASGVALLFPVVYGADPAHALIMLAGIYFGAQYGGTITSVLLRMPGEPSSIVTTFDGYPLARQGRAGTALAIAALASFVAGTLGTFLLMALAGSLSEAIFQFGPPEMLVLVLVALVLLSGLDGSSFVKGMAATALGVVVASVGLDPQSGVPRFTFGTIDLYGGLGIVEVLIGVFALGEILRQTGQPPPPPPVKASFRSMWPRRDDVRQALPAAGRGSVLGFVLGLLPGAGPTVASFASYQWEKRRSTTPERFGNGAIEGVAAPEAANNAAASGAMVPTLTLGIPGSGTAAVLLGAFVVVGVQPGPTLMTDRPEIFWGLIASFYIGNVLLLILNLPLAPLFGYLLRVPYAYLYPAIIFVALLGAYSVESRIWGIWVAVGFGALGYLAMSYGFPLAPFVLGLILGPQLESSLGRTLSMGHGSLGIVFDRPLSSSLVAASLLVGLVILGRRLRAARRRPAEPAPAPVMEEKR